MKLILSLTLIWALSSSVGALQCLQCQDVQCSSTGSVSCSSETKCIAAAIQTTSSGTQVQQLYKACASSSLCPAPGFYLFSANLGYASVLASASCCSTDNCNNSTQNLPGTQLPTSLTCSTCNPSSSQCNSTVQCRGDEDRCFQASVTSGSSTASVFGCASQNLCAASSDPLFLQNFGNISSTASCCATSLCNPVVTTTTATQTTTPIQTTTTTTTTLTTASSDACCIQLVMIHLLLGLFFFSLY